MGFIVFLFLISLLTVSANSLNVSLINTETVLLSWRLNKTLENASIEAVFKIVGDRLDILALRML